MAVFIGTVLGSMTAVAGSAATAAAIMGTGVTIGWGTALTIASIAYQASQARRARRAADSRAGQFVAFEGAIGTLPIVYGRARVAGIKVYQNTHDNYKHATNNPGAVEFMAGNADGSTYEVKVDDPTSEEIRNEWLSKPSEYRYDTPTNVWYQIMKAEAGTTLDRDRTFGRSSVLYVQQALCVGPIEAVHEVFVDDFPYNKKEFKEGLKIVVNKDGGVSDPMMSANFPERLTAKFTGAAYASMAFRLMHLEPQYSGTPNVNFLVEGRKIRTISQSGNTYTLSEGRTYSNNPALCLLDYLMDADYGQGLTLAEIDLGSFYKAAIVCNKSAVTAPVSGKIWKNTSGSRNTTSNTFKVFECNMVLNTSTSVRDNVNILLGSMSGARLVWANGTYKLSLEYPTGADPINVVGTVTDDVLMRETVDIQPPSLDERFNFCTVRFYDEAKDFKENTVTWPSKAESVYNDVNVGYRVVDHFRELETDVTAEGVTSKVLALAHAEEIVRSSRRAIKINFSIMLKDKYYEPGDILSFSSEALSINSMLVQIDEITVDSRGVASISATKFDKTSLAWVADDNLPSSGDVGIVTDVSVLPPTNFVFTPTIEGTVNPSISGKLSWTAAPAVLGYRLYYGKAGMYEQEWVPPVGETAGFFRASQRQLWLDLNTNWRQSPYEVPRMEDATYVFGIRSIGAGGKLSVLVSTTTSVKVETPLLPAPVMSAIPSGDIRYRNIIVKWSTQLTSAQQALYGGTEVWFNKTGSTPTVNPVTGAVSGATLIGTSSGGFLNFTDMTGLVGNQLHYFFGRNFTKATNKKFSNFSHPPSTATPVLTISAYLSGLSDYIDDQALTQLLRSQINWTADVNYTTARDWVMSRVNTVNGRVDTTRADVWTTLNNVVNGVTETVTKDGTSINTLYTLKQSSANSTAGLIQVNDVSANSTSANVRALRALASRVGGNSGTIIDLDTINTDANGTLISRLTSLDGIVTNPTTGLVAAHGRIADLDTVSVKKDGVEVGRISTLEATVNNATTGLPATYAKANEAVNLVTTKDNAMATRVTLLEASVNNTLPGEIALRITAGQVDTKIANATPNTATTTAINTAKSEAAGAVGLLHYGATAPSGTTLRPLKIGDVWHQPSGTNGIKQYIYTGSAWELKDDYLATNAMAAIDTVEKTKIGYCTIGGLATDHTNKTDCNNAGGTWHQGLPFASAVKQVQVSYTGAGGVVYTGGVEQSLQAAVIAYDSAGTALTAANAANTAATDVTNRLNATYALRVSSGNKVAGFGIANDGATSSFIIQANNFLVAGSDYGAGQVPFAVLESPVTYNGVNYPAGVYAQKAYIHDLQISRGQIQGGSIAAVYSAVGTTSVTLSVTLAENAHYIVVPLIARFSTSGGKGDVFSVPVNVVFGGSYIGYGSSIYATLTSSGEHNAQGQMALTAFVSYR